MVMTVAAMHVSAVVVGIIGTGSTWEGYQETDDGKKST